jgi:hypothetical protein
LATITRRTRDTTYATNTAITVDAGGTCATTNTTSTT